MDRQRIDKWLWHARFVRTRSDAARLVEGGFVRVNGQRMVAAAHLLRQGDVVTLALDRTVRVVRVEAFSEKRGNATSARALYADLAPGRSYPGTANADAALPAPTGRVPGH